MLANIPLSMDEMAERYPRLIRAMQWTACLSRYEAAATLRDIRYVNMGKIGPSYLDHGGGEAVSHFGGPRRVIQSAIRCRRTTRVTRKLATMARHVARTWEPGAAARTEIHVYDDNDVLLGIIPYDQAIAWGHALREADREQSEYSYPCIRAGITRRFF